MPAYVQAPPNCLQIELSEGCNLRCAFCGLNGIRGKDNDFKLLTLARATDLAERIAATGWNCRLEFAMHGEPTMNPEAVAIVAAFRAVLPRNYLMMTSNGGGLLRDPTRLIDGLLHSVNVLALDNYEHVKIVPKLLAAYHGRFPIFYYPQQRQANPHRRRKPHEREIVVVKDISIASDGTHATLNNHAGAAGPKNDKAAGKRCAKPFREIAIRWDGNVAICCNDWRGEYKCGNVFDTPLRELWQNQFFMAARRKLLHGHRDFGPCQGCDATSYRPGLLPDPMGKASLPQADASDAATIATATAGASYTPAVPRVWELAAAPAQI